MCGRLCIAVIHKVSVVTAETYYNCKLQTLVLMLRGYGVVSLWFSPYAIAVSLL